MSSSTSSSSSNANFIESARFAGHRAGHFFGKGPKGLGYYVDPLSTAARNLSSSSSSFAGQGAKKSPRANPYLSDNIDDSNNSNSNSNSNSSSSSNSNSNSSSSSSSSSSNSNGAEVPSGRREDAEGADGSDGPGVDISKLNPQQRKLHELKMKHNQCIKFNRNAVEEEFKRLKDPKYDDKKRFQEKSKQESQSKRIVETPNDLDIRADKSMQLKEQEEIKLKRQESMGFAPIGSVGALRAYEKNLKKLPTSSSSSSSASSATTTTGSDGVGSSSDLDYGSRESARVDSGGLDRLAKFMVAKEDEKAKHNKRQKTHFEGVETNAINDDNVKFNKRAKKIFDPYTAEIRQNLERGTAI